MSHRLTTPTTRQTATHAADDQGGAVPTGLRADAVRGYTPRELARILRVSPDRVRGWILSGELGAINTATARCGKPRYVVLPHHLTAFERDRKAAKEPAQVRRQRRQTALIDYFPD